LVNVFGGDAWLQTVLEEIAKNRDYFEGFLLLSSSSSSSSEDKHGGSSLRNDLVVAGSRQSLAGLAERLTSAGEGEGKGGAGSSYEKNDDFDASGVRGCEGWLIRK
jgi:hypothetical protein